MLQPKCSYDGKINTFSVMYSLSSESCLSRICVGEKHLFIEKFPGNKKIAAKIRLIADRK